MRPRCLNCGYDLRDLEGDGPCPECGLEAWVSRAKPSIAVTPSHLRDAARGAAVAGAGMLASGATAFVLSEAGAPGGIWYGVLHACLGAGLLGYLYGCVRLAEPEPKRDFRDLRWGVRRLLRVVSLALMVPALVYVAARAHESITGAHAAMLYGPRRLLIAAVMAASFVQGLLAFMHITTLVHRVGPTIGGITGLVLAPLALLAFLAETGAAAVGLSAGLALVITATLLRQGAAARGG